MDDNDGILLTFVLVLALALFLALALLPVLDHYQPRQEFPSNSFVVYSRSSADRSITDENGPSLGVFAWP